MGIIIDPSLIDHRSNEHDGYPEELQAGDTFDVLWDVCGSASRAFPDHLWIEKESDRIAQAKLNDLNKTWGRFYIDRFTNQNPTHECTCHALRTVAEGCWNRQRGIIFPDGPKKDFRYEESSRGSIWLSPLSIYAEANPRQWGGASCRQVLEIAIRRGFLPDKIQPADYKFKHTLQGTTGKGGKNQSSGDWLRVSQFPDGWEETAKFLRPQEVIITSNWEHAQCLLLAGYILEGGRDGHAIPYSFWDWENDLYGYIDSYDVIRYDTPARFRRAVASSVYTIASMTLPDDSWLTPAMT